MSIVKDGLVLQNFCQNSFVLIRFVTTTYREKGKTFWKIETANALSGMYLGGTA